MLTNKKIILDVWKKGCETVTAVQGEVNSRFLTIKLIDENGNIDLTGKTVKFQAEKPDGKLIFNNATIIDATEGIVQVGLTSQMSAVTGLLKDCEIVIIDQAGYTLVASGINIYIMPSLGEAVEESLSESTVYHEMEENMDAITAHLNDTSNPHKLTVSQINAIPCSEKNAANGVAALDSKGKLLTSVETDPTVPSWAKAELKPSYAFSEIGNTPTTLSGYGITDAINFTDVGSTSNLTTTAKTVVGAINELDSDISGVSTTCSNITGNIGSLSSLTTTSKTVVGAINELDSEFDGIYKTYSSITDLGLSYPCTTVQVVQAMPNNSRTIIDVEVQSNTLTDAPCSYGVMEIEKVNSSKIKIIFNKSLSSGTNGVDYYLAEYNSSNSTITWNKIFTSNPSCQIAISNGGTGATTATTAISNLHGVEQTSADITYYINASTGSDTNAGSSSYPFKTIQHAINVLPKCINHDVKIYLATGTYAEVVTIKGFFGGGSFSLYGNTASALSTSYTITGQIHIENCHMKLFLNGLNVSTTTTRAIETYTSNFVQVYYCTVAGAADVGIGFLAGSRGEVFVCSSSNKLYMYSVTGGSFIRIRGSNLGSGNTYGVKSGDGSLVMLIDLIGASVATTAYLLDTGGSIIAGGKYIS
ncbi:MAG: hypothetical protein RUMPE_00505 [Eubacteriales bacterium SKADARSKE-1]|nr:hypothetical protein [Eubacteriales bacterium SKADARSKE-1]